ncbi:Gx transporter family protein [Intestinibacillus sp. Marseille-P6563]|uniref:Gx transporter family protein n=1 Tax=Intestinibacillus sp. Marseille-P6563 TaxID=2364792 RepID=UPI000F05068F|nr:Gx transporter family protein [Intestinibacillus sp. Marseille-P6563]
MKKIAQGGLLVAVALVLSLVEKMFPLQAVVPIPGIKLGLANVVTLFALTLLGTQAALTILLCRVTLASIFMGSITGFLFSLFGGLLALLVMRLLLLREDRWFSLVGVSIGGAATHNIGQIGAAILTLGTLNVAAYLPLLLVSSIPMGWVTGLTASAVLNHWKKIRF